MALLRPGVATHCRGHSRFLVIGLILFAGAFATGVSARGADSTTVPVAHADLVRRALEVTTQRVFAEFPYRRGKPLWITADGEQPDAAVWFEAAAVREMYARGMLVRQPQAADSALGDGNWLLRYRLSTCRLQLTDPTRRAFLGRIWLRRSFTVGVSVSLWDAGSNEMLWTNAADSTFEDWIPKRSLPVLADTAVAFLSPEAPSTAWERAVRPGLNAVAAATVLTTVFLIIR